MKSFWKKAGIGLLVLLALLLGGMFWYLTDNYEADGAAEAAMQSSSAVRVTEEADWAVFEPAEAGDPDTALIFYQGGKVEEESYAPLLQQLAARGVTVYLPDMPFDLAVFDSDAAGEIIAAHPEVSGWYLAGHSLGGVMATSYAADHPDQVDGLIYLASYPATDISDTDLRVLSLYGSEDMVLDPASYEEAKPYLPADAEEVEIAGGNHAGFGNYGEQAGDGEAAISSREQQEQTADLVADFIHQIP